MAGFDSPGAPEGLILAPLVGVVANPLGVPFILSNGMGGVLKFAIDLDTAVVVIGEGCWSGGGGVLINGFIGGFNVF